ncbi:MAG: bifunctional adenosylcobinamide kinase/adenosylcobinamide-phosphate guanylyltransferase [Sulfurimonas sp.]|uniref:bifunctional adenosylcobinamide kinase/adenosylcobinamide-phosphate guanylyltransferase n=1 Tax=Sulfurimonas sp. TaxID=2022749 RepID=UPI002610578D|nr:bifunctional adenosylcobinamide kinase/adenosylcobinamide-phosphate guanylyltransferase [Sulfurimonas sp.]MCW8894588.1 bifunctional adenosylcobinamide kinase/adenosylcobinamide-phosphate guanylyltransferase [Sulfurimonas sp.]MCW8953793.1 bifunctional adenosylcobinamide kinase/adenosylcobinamide-phosphate guanylyltransferase [Sulfurimonas sp.]MCW9068019.1 bifunctional adenosylcobinamide kinase/adenosylcobinamide-phosphate guanylyltransferase [Sulfurimonas sp.]
MKRKKTLFIGGIKSGKSFNAQNYALNNSTTKPIYLATTEFIDEGMQIRIDEHKKSRQDRFITLEEPLKLYESISTCQSTVLVECVSMWINNMLYHGFCFDDMANELEAVLELDKSVVFVLNDVGTGIIPDNKLSREFVDISGKLSQLIASRCEEVYHTIAGISTRIK